ncbi:MAG: site-2 protease family protein [Candidatus Pacearchaeota archaeon]
MKFIFFDLAFLALFILFVVVFLYKRRQKLAREGPLFIYRTRFGLKLIEKVSRHKKFLKIFGMASIVFGYLLMLSAFILLFFSLALLYSSTQVPSAPPLAPVIPYFTSIFKIDFMPPFYFTYWIIIILLIAISHEFAHGIIARGAGLKIKSTGFGFLGPFIAAFVEPDEKAMEKKSIKTQLAILSAGSFANFILALVFVAILQLYFLAFYTFGGFIGYMHAIDKINISSIESITIENSGENLTLSFDAFSRLNLSELENKSIKIKVKNQNGKNQSGYQSYQLDSWLWQEQKKQDFLKKGFIFAYFDSPARNANLTGPILEIDGKPIKSSKDIEKILLSKKPNQTILIKTENKSYELILASHPSNSSRAFLGIAFFKQGSLIRALSFIYPRFNPSISSKPKFGNQHSIINFFKDLILWLIIIGLSVALFNMLPFSIFDGGKVCYLTALAIFKKKTTARKVYAVFGIIILLLLLLMFGVWLFKI